MPQDMQTPQPWLFASDFATGTPPNLVYCHQDFLEKLQEHRNHAVGKRASLLLQRLAVDERRLHFKATHGVNRGWRRSRLGGNQGSHFYAWWAPRGAPPLRDGDGFSAAPEGAIFVRDIRHHDDHSPAPAHSLEAHYLPVSVEEMRRDEYGPSPWTQPQARFAGARSAVRILKGHPGSGKTTALLHAADQTAAERVLYLTFSRELAGLARLYFDRYCSRSRHFHVVTFDNFLRQLLQTDAPLVDPEEARKLFRSDLGPIARSIAPWHEHRNALYDELHAHLVGSALPLAAGRFEACNSPRVAERNYRSRRAMHVGPPAAAAAADAAARLEKGDKRSLADRYFPELALAWRAAQELSRPGGAIAPEFLDFDCIAVDECQDLTVLESFVVIELAAAINKRRKMGIPVMFAGDEAQTVRPTDFEWAWMNELLHHLLITPAEFKLSTNLRSPERIARLVNRVWDLYSVIEKRDRPSGSGYADIEDDATDQILYCTAAPGADLNELIENLSQREGLAMVTLDDEPPAHLPEHLRRAILTPHEIKGLDFHSVCVLDAGRHLARILQESNAYDAGIDSLRKRLSIDAFRVALSRPTERLLWLDMQPAPRVVQDSLEFLNYGVTAGTVSPAVPSAILKTLDEEALDLEERIQRCQQDARQFLQIRPELALSRANQAVALLGDIGSPAAITDESLRAAVYGTVTEICFCLACRRTPLPPELGRPDLFREAHHAAMRAGRPTLGTIIFAVEAVLRSANEGRLPALDQLARAMARNQQAIEPWLLAELGDKVRTWLDELEAALPAGENAAILSEILPPFYDALKLPDADARKQRLQQRSIQALIKNRKHAAALGLLQKQAERDYRLEAACLDGLGRYSEAAEAYRRAGEPKEALRCYRSITDFDAALALIREISDHPAAESYEWLSRLRTLLGEKPEKFNRVMQPSEKKVLEGLLEQALGVTRRKPAATKKAATKKTAPKPAAAKRKTVRAPEGGVGVRGRPRKEPPF
jgi:superfamily I DNA/RNA helicase